MLKTLNLSEYKKLLLNYKKAIYQLRKWNISVSNTSRLCNYCTELQKLADGYIPATLKELADLTFIIVEIDEITDIILSYKKEPSKEIKDRLRDLQKDVDIRTQNNNQARNSQFELYMKFLLENGGLTCELGNPDIMAHLSIGKMELEAKRPNSNGIDSNIRKALKQLNPENPGIILLSLDHLLLGNNNIIKLEENENGNDGLVFLEKAVSEWTKNNRPIIQKRLAKKKSACAIILLVKVPIVSDKLHKFDIGNHMRLITYPSAGKEKSMDKVRLIEQSLENFWNN